MERADESSPAWYRSQHRFKSFSVDLNQVPWNASLANSRRACFSAATRAWSCRSRSLTIGLGVGSSRSSGNRLKFAFNTPLERRTSSLFLRRSARDLSSSLFLCSSILIICARWLWRRQPGCVFSRRCRKCAIRSACEDEDEPESPSLSSSRFSSSDVSTAGISFAKSTGSDIDRSSAFSSSRSTPSAKVDSSSCVFSSLSCSDSSSFSASSGFCAAHRTQSMRCVLIQLDAFFFGRDRLLKV